LGWLPGCAPSQLLHTCSLAEYERPEKVLDFTATNEAIGVTNILLVLNQNTAATRRKVNSITAENWTTKLAENQLRRWG